MAKYLRYLAEHFTHGNSIHDDLRDDPTMWAAVRESGVPYLCWMYEFYALPLRSGGVGKVNLYLTPARPNPPPVVLPGCPEDRDGEGIASVFESFDFASYRSLGRPERAPYHLDRIHTALIRCGREFHWDTGPLDRARDLILQNEFRFCFFWKKPLSSPDRRTKVQAVIDVTDQARIYLAFFDGRMNPQRRVLLCTSGIGSGVGEMELHRIAWLDNQTVQVTQRNGHDFWTCTTDGDPVFHYPRADHGDPHGEYDLGQIYLEGRFVRQDRQRGLKLIESAARSGYKHAIRSLERLSAAEPGAQDDSR